MLIHLTVIGLAQHKFLGYFTGLYAGFFSIEELDHDAITALGINHFMLKLTPAYLYEENNISKVRVEAAKATDEWFMQIHIDKLFNVESDKKTFLEECKKLAQNNLILIKEQRLALNN